MEEQQRSSASTVARRHEMPIALCKKGDSGSIRKIVGKDDACRYLEGLGFVEGTTVTVVSRLFGSVIVDIRGSRIALDESMANRIIVG